jgi:23S rRNA pseudouridine2605 synthase
MRINQFLARHTDLSRRKADEAVAHGRVEINGTLAKLGDIVVAGDNITLDDQAVKGNVESVTIMLNKPEGYVVSREGQGNRTIYDILPSEHHNLNPVGRLDMESSGLLLLTNDGELANRMTHPSFEKEKIYEVILDKPLEAHDQDTIHDKGVELDDGPSKLKLKQLDEAGKNWQVSMHEGRNRQIRRSFAALGYRVIGLHRTSFGPYKLEGLELGKFKKIS